MAGVRAWARIDVRRRWRSLAVLALLVALSAGTVMTAVAGARRADSALDRLLAETHAATVRIPALDADVDRFRADVAEATGRDDPEVRSLGDEYDVHRRSIRFEAGALLALGGAAALAALFLVGQAIWRHVSAGAEHRATLEALGMDRRQRLVGAVLPLVAAGTAGAAVGAGASVVASRWFPLGTAAVVEPDPGVRVDPVVLGAGFLICVLAVGVVAVAGAVAALLDVRRRPPASHPSRVVAAIGRVGLPLPLHLGTRFALEPGRGRVRVPVVSTLLVAVLGVGGLLGALLVADGVQESLDHPDRFGRTYDTGTFTGLSGRDFVPTARLRRALLDDPAVAGAGALRVATATAGDARSSVVLYGVDDGASPLAAVVLEGRMPDSQDEVALAPQSLAGLGVDIGGTVRLAGSRDERMLTVVGTVLMPEGPDNRYDEGGWLSRHGFDRLFKGFDLRLLLLAGADGRSPAEVSAAANAAVAREVPDAVRWLLPFEAPSGDGPGEQLRQVRVLPYVLGGFLALLAAGVVGHALITAVRRRGAELATLRAVGTTPVQTAGIVYAQSAVAAVTGLVFGIPLGIAVGRTVWRLVAESTPLLYVPPTAWWAVLAVVPAAALSAAVFAVLPAARAARGQVAAVLRTE